MNRNSLRCLYWALFFILVAIGCDKENIVSVSTDIEAKWSRTYEEDPGSGFSRDPHIDNEHVYVSTDKTIYCYNVNDGGLAWTSGPITERSISGNRILGDDDFIYFNEHNIVYTVDRKTGLIIWKTTASNVQLSVVGVGQILQSKDNILFSGYEYIALISKYTGVIEKYICINRDDPSYGISRAGKMFITDERLYVPVTYYNDMTEREEAEVLCYDMYSYNLLWSYKAPNRGVLLENGVDSVYWSASISSVAVEGDWLIALSGTGIIGLDVESGEQEWIRWFEGEGFPGNGVVIKDNVAIAGSNVGNVYGIKIDNGEILWRKNVGLITLWEDNKVLNNMVIISAGKLWCFDVKTGSAIKVIEAAAVDDEYEDAFFTAPAIFDDRFAVLSARKVFVFEIN